MAKSNYKAAGGTPPVRKADPVKVAHVPPPSPSRPAAGYNIPQRPAQHGYHGEPPEGPHRLPMASKPGDTEPQSYPMPVQATGDQPEEIE